MKIFKTIIENHHHPDMRKMACFRVTNPSRGQHRQPRYRDSLSAVLNFSAEKIPWTWGDVCCGSWEVPKIIPCNKNHHGYISTWSMCLIFGPQGRIKNIQNKTVGAFGSWNARMFHKRFWQGMLEKNLSLARSLPDLVEVNRNLWNTGNDHIMKILWAQSWSKESTTCKTKMGPKIPSL